ncbi:MAG: HAMP domain-containing histidine kinase [Bacteroidales bacterium]|nr:HAMP domain-containing histidine kinase [Bacteroidales bacterium]
MLRLSEKIPRKSLLKLLVTAATVVAALVAHALINKISSISPLENDGQKLQSIILTHEQRLYSKIDAFYASMEAPNDGDLFSLLDSIARGDNYVYYVFRADSLVAWHNATLPINNLEPAHMADDMIKADNGFYFVTKKFQGEYGVFALLRIKRQYSYDNEFLIPAFDQTLNLNRRNKLVIDYLSGGCEIHNREGRYLFSITDEYSSTIKPTFYALDWLSLIVWLLASMLVVRCAVRILVAIGRQAWVLPFVAVCCAGIYVWALNISLSETMMQSFLFSPQVYAYAWWMPSLAFMLLAALLLFAWIFCFYKYFNISALFRLKFLRHNTPMKYITAFAVIYLIFMLINVGIYSLIYHSSDLAIYVGNLDIKGPTLVKIAVLSFFIMSVLLIFSKLYSSLTPKLSVPKYAGLLAAFTLVVALPMALLFAWLDWCFVATFFLFNFLFFIIFRKDNAELKFSMFVWVMFVSALFLITRLTLLNIEKEKQNRQLLTNNLAFQLVREDDPVAEQLLKNIEDKLIKDSVVYNIIKSDDPKLVDDLHSYIHDKYFNGYLSKYDLQVIPCRNADSQIHMSNNGEEYNCYEYFTGLIEEYGQPIDGKSHFYCLIDNVDGRPCYFGQFEYENLDNRLYLELDSRLYSDESGYPEILINSRDYMNTSQLNGYSYAKYYDGYLMTKYGDYNYPNNDTWFGQIGQSKHKELNTSNTAHSIYEVMPHQIIVLSYPTMSVTQFVTDLSFLFLSTFLVCLLTQKIVSRKEDRFYSESSIHQRIQSTFVFFVMILLVVFCVMVGSTSVERYETNSRTKMSQSLTSVKNIAQIKFGDYNDILEAPVDVVLQQAFDVLNIDTHIYTPDGILAGTSRRELFNSGIVSPLINSNAFALLRNKNSGDDVFVFEHIGDFVYFSIYTPLFNYEGHLIAYINVPYFTDVNAMRNQLFSTIVPLTNSFMLIILFAILFSSFLAQSITKPLVSIRESIKRVGLQKQNAKIDYPNNDEIGALVNEYNRMLDELAYSAEKLAANERELTWREMARQIAHEIKNPLTPMKLSVQYLIKSWEAKREDFDTFIHKVANTLTEQIDQLSYVASQFSNLAKMQNNVPLSRVDAAERLANTVMLFERSDQTEITFDRKVDSAFVYANADQLTSVFNNLIKNAIQASRPDEIMRIHATVDIIDTNVMISIADNGHGIPPEIQEKIFKPNFTTKSTGMGLGLAIVKSIIVNSHGNIWFKTEQGKGTTFYIELPVCEEDTQ